jgi:hypothetical protein
MMASDYIPPEQRATCSKCGGVIARHGGDHWQHRTLIDEYIYKDHRPLLAETEKM